MIISTDMYAARNPKVAWRIIEGKAVIVTPETSMLHELNSVGSKIWEFSDGQTKIGEIIDKIKEEFRVDDGIAKSDTLEFFQNLSQRGLLITSEIPVQEE